uniref:Peptidase C1A papain C-terminal domain-containing protein n=1 Tax=Meloidogyne incognita TaxID=6306 RepID=A0A914KS81_MELIC
MKKITILFAIFLILNISTTTSDPLEDLIRRLHLDPLGIILNLVLSLLRGLLGPTLPLNNAELKELTETLKELSELGYSISQEELLRIAQNVADINKITYNIEFDARTKWPGCKSIIDYVQHQGYCGSCWAHSAASAYTDRHCIELLKKVSSIPNNASYTFSAYDLLSCSKENGCDGGRAVEAYRWIEKNGICTGTDFPRKDGCKPYPFAPTVKEPKLEGCKKNLH